MKLSVERISPASGVGEIGFGDRIVFREEVGSSVLEFKSERMKRDELALDLFIPEVVTSVERSESKVIWQRKDEVGMVGSRVARKEVGVEVGVVEDKSIGLISKAKDWLEWRVTN